MGGGAEVRLVGSGVDDALAAENVDKVLAGCAEAAAETGEVVSAANFNDPKQTVISGSKAGVDKACELLKAMGAKRALLLAVSAPFHCALMKPAAEALRERLATVKLAAPAFPVVNNIDVAAPVDAASPEAPISAVTWVRSSGRSGCSAWPSAALITRLLPCQTACAASGMLQLPPSALETARSACTASQVGAWVSWAS